ncbi:MAG: hypothetical protein HY268_27620 [Deltaproteobacteria bacterium]|nr:hypothetical protein [Deltaproteobacteria bacterium]
MPVVSSPPTSAATPPAVPPAQAAPIPQLLNPQEAQRAARREARQARTAEHHNEASLDKLRELAAAAKAARGQPLPSPEAVQKALSEASAPRTATPKTKSSSLTSTAVTMPPNTSLSFLQWSPEPDRRLAFIKINGGPLTLAHEGDTVEGYTVVEIRRDAVELNAKGRSFTLQAEE